MKRSLFLLFITFSFSAPLLSQKLITASGMKNDAEVLASPSMQGRMNGSDALQKAAGYLASRARETGLRPVSGESYLQAYSIIRKTFDPAASKALVISEGDTSTVKETMYNLLPHGPADLTLEGEVLFAGYGIISDRNKYNDLEGMDAAGKILLIMDGSPSLPGGKPFFAEEDKEIKLQSKLGMLLQHKPKALLIVPDPATGFRTTEESNPGMVYYLGTLTRFSDSPEEPEDPVISSLPRIIFISRNLADELLKGTGKTLEELQGAINTTMKPRSFVTGKKLIIKEKTLTKEISLNNVAGYIEGRDPMLKNEVIVFSAHYDHIGTVNGKINPGADDNASGCSALLSIAGQINAQKKKPKRSVLFLWFSGEEIGLYGSEYYTSHPLFPLKNTVADLNLDMIGRIKTPADSSSETPMTGPEQIFAITDSQSTGLKAIADAADKKSRLDLDYSLSGKDHPLMLFARSDHYNFVMHDVPVVYFTAGIHTDYHTPGDIIEKLNFKKMELAARLMYNIGMTVANRKERIKNDNPYSSWEENK